MTENTKSRVLEVFEQNRGATLSGEALAGMINVSRNAVWKAVCALKKDGYRIGATTNKGYVFCGSNDIVSAQSLKPYLIMPANAEKIRVFDVLDSTNQMAKEAAVGGAEHGSVIIAARQNAGKGRHGRAFFSPPGGIYMSFVLRPENLSFATPTAVTAFAAVTVCEAIESVTGKTPSIKWVNDIFLGNLKICGISTEAAADFESGKIAWVVLGIGVNYDCCEFPDGLKGIAGAIFKQITNDKLQITNADENCAVGRELGSDAVLPPHIVSGDGAKPPPYDTESPSLPIHDSLFTIHSSTPHSSFLTPNSPPSAIRHSPPAPIHSPSPSKSRLIAEIINGILTDRRAEAEIFAAYKKRLNMLGKRVKVFAAHETFEAVALDIDESGRLMVKTGDGAMRLLNAGEISIRGLGEINE